MKFSIGFLFCLLSLNVFGQTATTKESLQKNYIEFGQGGGFTGVEKAYIITPDGDLYSVENSLVENSTLNLIKKIKRRTVRKIFKYADKSNLNQIRYNNPGNTYSFIYLFSKNTKYPIIWGNTSSTPPQSITELFTKLNNLL